MELNDTHKAQVARFITFFKGKRERLLADRESERTEFTSDRLADDQAIFNTMDVMDLVEAYHAQVIGCMREAIDEFINHSAVYVSQVFLQAEQSGLTLDAADVSTIEDQNQVAQIAELAAKGAAPPPAAKRQFNTLPTLGQTGGAAPGGTADPTVLAKIQELEEENRQMRERYQLMQEQVSALLKERSALATQLEKAGMSAAPTTVPESLAQSSQFKELKAIVKKKSDEVKQLRMCLQKAGLPLPGTGGGVELAPDDD